MFRAELVDFVVQLVSNPKLLVVFSVVEDSVIDILFFEAIDDFYFVEINEGAVGCATRNVFDNISLYADLHFYEILKERYSEMKAGLTEPYLQNPQPLVDSHIALLYLVKTR